MKRVNIIEAIKANEHSRVRADGGYWFEVGELNQNPNKTISVYGILAEWEIEEKPLEAYVNVYDNGRYSMLYDTKAQADNFADSDRIRCVKMREVVE